MAYPKRHSGFKKTFAEKKKKALKKASKKEMEMERKITASARK